MLAWLIAGGSAIFILLITIILVYFLIIRRRRFSRNPPIKTPPFQPSTKRLCYPLFRSTKQVFNWDDHPSSIIDVVENGWSRFTFTNYTSSQSLRSSLLCGTGDKDSNHNQVEFSWEVGQESSDLMQKIQFHSKLITINGGNTSTSSSSSVRMVLPLPGPSPSFPHEAYFEITVLKLEKLSEGKGEDEMNTKLILEKNYSSSLTTGSNNDNNNNNNNNSTRRGMLKEIRRGGGIKMSVGLTGGSPASGKLPGSYPGSVGFNSNGSVFLAGMKLSSEYEKEDWAQEGAVIGCGFNPSQKKVFFTVDSEIVHVINSKSEDFGMPLYPILTSNNINLTLLVNLGQSPFKFLAANSGRTQNPCFNIGPKTDSPEVKFGYEDSKELFSIGRIDAEWLSHNATVRSYEESEVDLFELVLDSVGRSSVHEHNSGK